MGQYVQSQNTFPRFPTISKLVERLKALRMFIKKTKFPKTSITEKKEMGVLMKT